MNRTTGADAIALSIAALVSEDRRRALRVDGRGKAGKRIGRNGVGREIGRKAWNAGKLVPDHHLEFKETYRQDCSGKHDNCPKIFYRTLEVGGAEKE